MAGECGGQGVPRTKNHLLPFFEKRRLREIKPSDVGSFLESKADEGYAGNTMQNLYGLLRLMVDIAAQYDLIEKSPVRSKIHKPEFEKAEKVTLTGMRIGEAMALR